MSASRLVFHSPTSGFSDLTELVQRLEENWCGWSGVREGESLGGGLRTEASHQFGHVHLRVTDCAPRACRMGQQRSERLSSRRDRRSPRRCGPRGDGGRRGSWHELYFMCDDLEATMSELQTKGVAFTHGIPRSGGDG